jgi:hypothetical protein
VPDVSGPFSLLPAVLAGLFGVGVLEIAYADDDKVCVVFFFFFWRYYKFYYINLACQILKTKQKSN